MKTFESICQENYARIYRYVSIMTKDKTMAEDITQEVFLKAYEKGKDFLQHPNPEGFLCKTAKFLTYDTIRMISRKKEAPLEENEVATQGDLLDTIYSMKNSDFDEIQLIPQVIDLLSPEEKELYCMFYIKKYSIKEIAQKLSVGQSAVKMRCFRLRHRIKKAVSDLNMEELLMKGRDQSV